MSLWRAVTVTAPGAAPLTVEQIKAHLRIDGTDEDEYLVALMAAGVSAIDGPNAYGVAMMTQTWTLTLDAFPQNAIRLPGWPIKAITTVIYYPSGGGSAVTMDSADYRLAAAAEPAMLETVPGWPRTADRLGAVRIAYTLGESQAENVDGGLVQALRMLVAHWHMNREAVAPGGMAATPLGFEMLMAARRRGWAG